MLLLLLVIGVSAEDSGQALDTVSDPGVICAPGGDAVGIRPYELANARTIIDVGTHLQVPDQGIVIALAAAWTEDGLDNDANDGTSPDLSPQEQQQVRASLQYPHDDVGHDHDSIGIFQQRPSAGWGTVANLMDPNYAAKAFFGGPGKPDHNMGLLDVAGWQNMSVGQAAQAVQHSARPDAYGRSEGEARLILGAVRGITCDADGREAPFEVQTVIDASMSQLGVPYSWGGGDWKGPTKGIDQDTNVVGFDCSGLMVYAFNQDNVTLPHSSQQIWNDNDRSNTLFRDPNSLQPGDMIFLGHHRDPNEIYHVALYIGNGAIVEAPEDGKTVQVNSSGYWRTDFVGALWIYPGTVRP